jgi:hypothetical protein
MLYYLQMRKVVGDIISQCFIFKNFFIKYNKSNGIIPMKTHVEFTTPWVVCLEEIGPY